jgi:hypothetical protein
MEPIFELEPLPTGTSWQWLGLRTLAYPIVNRGVGVH